MTCLDDATVLGLIEGRVTPAALDGIDDHLDACATCRDVVSQVARVASPARVLERGHIVGRYVVGELIGAGAMGRVYSAWEPELDRRVALKILVTADGSRERVVREAQAMARLDHPNVVGVHEVGTSPDGVFVAMELVDGESLRSSSTRDWREVVSVLVGVARGLAAVHDAGVVHRDIKPDNLIVGADGRARVGDFGLARAGASDPTGTVTGTLATGTPATGIAGTPAYMAPEVLRGERATTASDQFSFGVTAWEALTGSRPWGATTWSALLADIEAKPPASLRGVPGWLDAILRRCLAIDPARRYPSMHAVADALATGAARRSPVRWAAAVAVGAVAASTLTWLLVRPAHAPSSCAVDDDALASVWNPSVRARLDPASAAAVDRWTRAWIDERATTCTAARTLPAPTIAARTRCLDQRQAELGALLVRLDAPNLTDALALLPAPAECGSVVAGAADPVPLDPARAALVTQVTTALPAIRAAHALGDARTVVDEAARVVGLARASEHAPTLAEALLAHADVLRGTSKLARAHEVARDALAAAERGHDDLLAARAWITRVITAGDRRELDLAEDFGAIAAAAVERAGSPPHLHATLLRLRGLVAYNRGDHALARTLLTDARARTISLAGERSLEVSALASALGSVERVAGDLDAAQRWHASALAIDRALRSPAHPDVVRDLHNLAGILRLRGDLDAAERTYREALDLEIAARGDRTVQAGLTLNSLGLVHLARGDLAAARGAFERARDALTGADHGDRAFAHHNLGLVAAASGDHATALAEYDRAAAVYARTVGPTNDSAQRLPADRARSAASLATPRPAAQRATTASPTTVTPAARTVDVPATPPPPPPPDAGPAAGVYGSTQPW